MKKIVSLVLAAAMLSTTAFAAVNVGVGLSRVSNPDDTLRIKVDTGNFTTGGTNSHTLSGIGWRMCNEYFSVSVKKFDKGANLVKEVKINDDEMSVDIVLNANFELVRPKAAAADNLVIKELSIKAKKSYEIAKDSSWVAGEIKKDTYTYGGDKTFKIGYDQDDLSVYEQELDGDPEYVDGTMVKFVNKIGDKDVPYATATYTEGDIYIEGRVYKDDKVFLETDYDINKDVLKLDDTATIRFINIKTNGLPTANTLQITAEEDEFIYKLVDGKLVASGLKWSSDDYAWVGKIRTSTSYVISDVELKAAAAGTEDKPATDNPNTGANDVVGIAAALAIVSLVAAGAVSLKK